MKNYDNTLFFFINNFFRLIIGKKLVIWPFNYFVFIDYYEKLVSI